MRIPRIFICFVAASAHRDTFERISRTISRFACRSARSYTRTGRGERGIVGERHAFIEPTVNRNLRMSVSNSKVRAVLNVNVGGSDERFSSNRNVYLKKYSSPEYSKSHKRLSSQSNKPATVIERKISCSFAARVDSRRTFFTKIISMIRTNAQLSQRRHQMAERISLNYTVAHGTCG